MSAEEVDVFWRLDPVESKLVNWLGCWCELYKMTMRIRKTMMRFTTSHVVVLRGCVISSVDVG